MERSSSPLLPLLVLLALGGCSSPQTDTSAQQVSAPVAMSPVTEPADRADALLARAARSGAGPREDLMLEAAEVLLDRGESARARTTLDALPSEGLGPEQRARRAIMIARILRGTGDSAGALRLLDQTNPGNEGSALPHTLQVQLLQSRAQTLQTLERPLDAARQWADLQPWLAADTDRMANAEKLLLSLADVGLGELERETAHAASDDWRGWLELSVVLRDIRLSPGEQRQRLEAWKQRYLRIAAFTDSAAQLAGEFAADIATPERVALLLPLSGRAAGSGQAVLQGYLAEHYRQVAAGEKSPSVAVLDTGGTPEGFAAAYRQITADGVDLVIGPLLKEELAVLQSSVPASVPTLALNFLETSTASIPQVFQFGIDPADEIRQLASDAHHAGRTRAVILADAAPRSRHLAEDFAQTWRASGGVVIDTLYLGDLNDYRLTLERTMLLDSSRERSETLGRLLGLELEIEPRRRADVELIVMVAEPAAARSIRAMLPFLYAGDIPVEGISLSNGGGANRENDLDLENLRFVDMPWFSDAERGLRTTTATQHGPAERLIALGADACRLQSRVGLLARAQAGGLGGATGELSVDTQRRLHRKGTWYIFNSGQARSELPRTGPQQASSTDGETTWRPEGAPAPQRSDALPKTEP